MAASKADIRGWLQEAKPEHTHMVVVCDTFDYDDYPIFVREDEDVRAVVTEHHERNMQRVVEVYDLKKDLEEQLNAHRTGLEYLP